VATKPHRPEKAFSALQTAFTPSIFNKRPQTVAVFSNQPDSLRWWCPRCCERGL
jgi:hypothetical protein